VGWPEQLITQAEAFGLAADWPIFTRHWHDPKKNEQGISLYCARDDKPMGQLRREGTVYNGSLDEILSMVLRHMVMAHDVHLNVRKEDAGGTAPVQAVD
jgi:hypothetical protein